MENTLNIDFLDKNIEDSSIDFNNEKKSIEELLFKYNIDIECKKVVNTLNYKIFQVDLKEKYRIRDIAELHAEIQMNFENVEEVIVKPIPSVRLLGIFLKKKIHEKLLLGSLMSDYKVEREFAEIPISLGINMNGEKVVKDLYSMPHMLISGTTGSGKTTLLESIIIQLLYKFTPDELKFMMIDTRGISLTAYSSIPYMLIPTLTDSSNVIALLNWVVLEMKNRYSLFSEQNVRDIVSYNKKVDNKLPKIVVIIDDFADIIDSEANNIELQKLMSMLSQEARASGIHLIISTYRPSIEIMQGIIKANISCRLALKMTSTNDSMIVLNEIGAEKLKKGEALIKNNGYEKAELIEIPYVSEENIEKITNYLKSDECHYITDLFKEDDDSFIDNGEEDPLLNDVIEMVIDEQRASVSSIQKRFDIGYVRAGHLIDQMYDRGIISGFEGAKPRKVLISKEEWNNKDNNENNNENITQSIKNEESENNNNKSNRSLIDCIIVLVITFIIVIILFKQ